MSTYIVNLKDATFETLSGIEVLDKNDKVIFLFKSGIKMDVETHILIADLKCQVTYQEFDSKSDMEYGFFIGKMASEEKGLVLIAPPAGIRIMAEALGVRIQDTIKDKAVKQVAKRTPAKSTKPAKNTKPVKKAPAKPAAKAKAAKTTEATPKKAATKKAPAKAVKEPAKAAKTTAKKSTDAATAKKAEKIEKPATPAKATRKSTKKTETKTTAKAAKTAKESKTVKTAEAAIIDTEGFKEKLKSIVNIKPGYHSSIMHMVEISSSAEEFKTNLENALPPKVGKEVSTPLSAAFDELSKFKA